MDGFLTTKKLKIKTYISLVKFEHTIFALPFAIIGFFTAYDENLTLKFDWFLFLKVILCMVFARNAAMAFNRYADRKTDSKNPRTAQRDMPSGRISPKVALIFVTVNYILFCTVTFFINKLTFYLSPIVIFVTLIYSYTKRFTSLCHFVLGAALALAPTGAYIAVAANISPTPILYSIAVLFWTAGFDIIYALQDEDFDKTQSLHSIPVFCGRKKAMILSTIMHIVVIFILASIGVSKNYGMFYITGTAIFSALLIYQHIIIKPNDLSHINAAFFTTNGLASIIFGIFNILELIY